MDASTLPPGAGRGPGALLSVRGLTTRFRTRAGTVTAVDAVGFDLAPGEILGLVGESGSGKSVMGLSLLGLVDRPGSVDGGRVLFRGEDLLGLSAEALRRIRGAHIAMVFQDPMMTLNPTLRIGTQMVEAIRAHARVPVAAARARSVAALDTVGIPSPADRLAAYPHELSGGMRQRVAIAIALLNHPALIIADEPTTALDVTIQAQILHEVRRLCRDQGTALIWISHDLSIVAGLADRIAVMYAGRIVELGTVDQVLDHPQHPYTRGLLDSVPGRTARGGRLRQIPGGMPPLIALPEGCAFRPRCPRAADPCLTAPSLVPTAAGGSVRCHFPLGEDAGPPMSVPSETHAAAAPAAGGAVLEVVGVSKVFARRPDLVARMARRLGARISVPRVRALDDVSLTVAAGEVVGLVGESGCGKSTLARILAGILPPTGGTVRFRGAPVVPGQADRAALRLQMVFQDPMSSLNPRLRVRDLVCEAPVSHGIVRRADVPDFLARLLGRVGLDPEVADRLPHQFSGGQRQRIGIARALAVNPELLICDEAVASLDVSIQAQILNLLMSLREALDLTLLFISHDLGVVRHLSDRIVVMYLGRVVEQADAAAMFASPNHPYTQALIGGMPSIDERRADYPPPAGEIPSPLAPPPGCHFHPRCPHAFARCRDERPALKPVAPGRLSACHLNDG